MEFAVGWKTVFGAPENREHLKHVWIEAKPAGACFRFFGQQQP
jgi:hypothetical protein